MTSLIMKPHHETLTNFFRDEASIDGHIEINVDQFNNIMMEYRDMQVMIISIVGPCAGGKSSFIKLITHDEEIFVGDGAMESGNGTLIYGPYQYNEIRTRFGLMPIDKDLLLYFIDTEGYAPLPINENQKMINLFFDQVLARYIAVSQITLIMTMSNVTLFESENLIKFIERVLQLSSQDNPLELIAVVTNQRFISEDNNKENIEIGDQYRNACENLSQVMPHKIKGLQMAKYIALSNYSPCDDTFEQPKNFYDRFKFAALDLIESIESNRISHIYDGKAIADQFQEINQNFNEQDFSDRLSQLKSEKQFDAVSRIYLPSVDRIIEMKKVEISNLYPNIMTSSSDENRLRVKTFNIDNLIKNAIDDMSQFDIPPSARGNCIENFIQYITDELTRYNASLYTEYLANLQERQIDYLYDKVSKIINGIASRLMVSLIDDMDQSKVVACFEEIDTEVNKAINEFKKKFNVPDETIQLASERIETKKQEIQGKLTECLKQIEVESK